MENKKFSSLLFLLSPQIIALIAEKNKIDEEKATELYYNSILYSRLEEEETKLWHLSALALFELFCEEQKTGKITYPEGV